jgi:phosphatidylinositol alpha-mannosyltransferase
VASDLDAFRRVLDDGRAGVLFRTGDPDALARCLAALLDDPVRRARLAAIGAQVVAPYDWPVVARQIVAVYETVIAAVPVAVSPDTSATPDLVGE